MDLLNQCSSLLGIWILEEENFDSRKIKIICSKVLKTYQEQMVVNAIIKVCNMIALKHYLEPIQKRKGILTRVNQYFKYTQIKYQTGKSSYTWIKEDVQRWLLYNDISGCTLLFGLFFNPATPCFDNLSNHYNPNVCFYVVHHKHGQE